MNQREKFDETQEDSRDKKEKSNEAEQSQESISVENEELQALPVTLVSGFSLF